MAEALISNHLNQKVLTDQATAKGNLVVCCGIADPGNLGTIIRTADWFGVSQVIVSDDSVDIYNEKVVRSSMGSFFNLAIKEVKSLQTELLDIKAASYTVIASQAEGGQTEPIKGPFCLILGSESHGIPQAIADLADTVMTIPKSPQAKSAESLNVGVSCGVLLFQLNQNL
jgi:TrmH family RNA methyltransferase